MKKEGRNEQRNRLIALLAALLFHAAVFFFMFYDRLTAVAPDEIEPKPMTTDISFGGEYVALGDIPEPDHTGEAAPKSASEEVQDAPAEETENSGPEGEGTPKKNWQRGKKKRVRSVNEKPAKMSDDESAAAQTMRSASRAAGGGKAAHPQEMPREEPLPDNPGIRLVWVIPLPAGDVREADTTVKFAYGCV